MHLQIQTFNALNSFYDEKFYKNKKKQINDLINYIHDWNSNKINFSNSL